MTATKVAKEFDELLSETTKKTLHAKPVAKKPEDLVKAILKDD